MQVIVLGGMARVGKTDVADYLEESAKIMGYNPVRLSFATPLKEAVAKENGYDCWRKFKEENAGLYRKECQDRGASARAADPDHWVNLWSVQLAELQRKETVGSSGKTWEETVVIADDCRYLNELEAAKMFEAVKIFIYAGERSSALPEADAAWRAHESEEMSQRVEAHDNDYTDLFDWALYNNKGVKELEDKLELRLDYFIGEHPSRFSNSCDCPECRSFRLDIQANEVIESFRETLEEIKTDTTLDEETRDRIIETFQDVIDDLESGEIDVTDVFKTDWSALMEDMDDDIDDDDADDSNS